MAIKRNVTKKPAVMVETRKISAHDTSCAMNIKQIVLWFLVILNTLMVVCILFNQFKIEADRVGGRENYKMVKQIYKTDAFKTSQEQQIQQALQMYEGGLQDMQVTPTVIPEESVAQ
jgi:hypothetical protein